jgi:putative redox protein
VTLVSAGLTLESHLARAPASSARDATRNGLLILHSLPSGAGSAAAAFSTFPELADRVATECGLTALTFAFRGAGKSPGEFSPAGWLADAVQAVLALRDEVETVWIAGFGFGGTVAVRVAALDAAVGGVAILGARSDLSDWADVGARAAAAHEAGLISTATPDDLDTWPAQIQAFDPLGAAEQIPPRPMLIVHGSADETVNPTDARAFADATIGEAELRVIAVAGHRLRHDPRAIAVLLGWLQRRAN